MSNNLWNQWNDCHNTDDQQKRQSSAKKSSCTPTLIDFTSKSGQFKGSSGNHTTTLGHCSCIDFNRRKLPCKHMYRLAMELGVIDTDFESNISDVADPLKKQTLQDSVSLIEKFPEAAQRLLQNILCNINSSSPCKCVLRTPELSIILSSGLLMEVESYAMQLSFYKFTDLKKRLSDIGLTCPIRKKQELIDWVLANASDRISELCYDSAVVSASEHIKARKIYMYLHRKYDFETNFVEGEGYVFSNIPLLQTQLPDDDVTKLLCHYGYYSGVQ